ncbi:fatty acyl-CoA reductase wat-like [Aphidius gifuensis]|uniref:fatty acyl-CoA reductase wat-like n=1 Tax=Aphidius gifuensis TaxID=684658 RepID=UPI001CDBADB4|nr:fatty acyl-CoA reductase wat-like [Aphidius gifuensis]
MNNNQILKKTTIQKFYTGQSIFITGGTGFLGKVLVEKLLRSCDVSKIYLLIRSKKGININDRLDNLFNDPLFESVKKNSPEFRNKIVPVAGDVGEIDLGLSHEDRELLIQEVSIVFHSAATVRFDEKLKIAMLLNTGGTLEVLKLVNEMKKLKVMVHVSTAYSNCHEDIIEEKIYPHPIEYENFKIVAETLSDEAIDDALPRILKNWPNTYTFTKALTEKCIKQMSCNKPVGIFRPGIIISVAEEPLPGWIDNYYGPTGGAMASSLGILKTALADPNVKANLVPVDYTVNALIACAWDIATQTTRRNDDMLIYNYVSTNDAPVTWNEFSVNYCLKYGHEYPVLQTKWYITFSITKSRLAFKLSMIFLHFLPALLVDSIFLCTGQKPKLYKMFSKIFKYLEVLTDFTMRDWDWKTNNVPLMWKRLDQEDKKIFKFSLTGFNWKEYSRNYIMGIKIYLFKEGLNTLEASKKRQTRSILYTIILILVLR